MRRTSFEMFCALAILAAMVMSAGIAAAQTETVLHHFKGGTADGANPEGGLITDLTTGALYGTTFGGGANTAGTVFQLLPTGETILYSFSAGSDGANPNGNLILDSAGNLYGTTFAGGPANAGTVFKLAPPASSGGPWTETVLYAFTGGSDGGGPEAGLIFDSAGNLYGTAGFSGTGNNGVIFQLTPSSPGAPWNETVLYSFAGGSDGSGPLAPLIFDSAGNLYSTTYAGGSSNVGTAFQLAPPSSSGGPWTETVLHTFVGKRDGANPHAGLIMSTSGALFGTTVFGGSGGGSGNGTVFELALSGGVWKERVLYRFQGGNDGSNPSAGLIFRGPFTHALVGTTDFGGSTGFGTIFQLNPGSPWTESVLYTFQGLKDGIQPNFGVIVGKGRAFYGTTLLAGSPSPLGVVFKFVP